MKTAFLNKNQSKLTLLMIKKKKSRKGLKKEKEKGKK